MEKIRLITISSEEEGHAGALGVTILDKDFTISEVTKLIKTVMGYDAEYDAEVKITLSKEQGSGIDYHISVHEDDDCSEILGMISIAYDPEKTIVPLYSRTG